MTGQPNLAYLRRRISQQSALPLPFTMHTVQSAPITTTNLTWQSKKFPFFPIQLNLDLSTSLPTKSIQLTFSPQKIPQSVDLYKGDNFQDMKKAIELSGRRSYSISCDGNQFRYLKVVLNGPVSSDRNFYGEVGISSLVVWGFGHRMVLSSDLSMKREGVHRNRLQRANIALQKSMIAQQKAVLSRNYQQAFRHVQMKSRIRQNLIDYQRSLGSSFQAILPDVSRRLSYAQSRLQYDLDQSSFIDNGRVIGKVFRQKAVKLNQLKQFYGEQGLLESRHLKWMDQNQIESKLAILTILAGKLPKKRTLTQTEHRMVTKILISFFSIKNKQLIKSTLKLLSLYVKFQIPANHRQEISDAMLKLVSDAELQEDIINGIIQVLDGDVQGLIRLLAQKALQAEEDQLVDIGKMAVLLHQKCKFQELLLAPIKISLLSHPSRRIRFQLNRLFNGHDKTCEFCGLQCQQFQQKHDYIDHLKSRCVMLIQCYLCQKLVEVQDMGRHLDKHNVQYLDNHCFYCRAGPIEGRRQWLTHMAVCQQCKRGIGVP